MNDATAAGRRPGSRAVAQAGLRPTLDRRRVLQLMLALPAAATVVAGCSGATTDRDDRPDPLVALADAARADAALAAAVIAADPTVAARIDPLRAARTEHAAALDAEIVRVGGVPSTATPSTAPAVGTAGPTVPAGAHRNGRSRAGGHRRAGAGGRRGVPARRRRAGAGTTRRAGRPRRLGRRVLRDLRGGARVSRGSARRHDAEGVA